MDLFIDEFGDLSLIVDVLDSSQLDLQWTASLKIGLNPL